MKNRFFAFHSARAVFAALLLSFLAICAISPSSFAQRINQYMVTTPNLGFTTIVGASGTTTLTSGEIGYDQGSVSFSMPFAFTFDQSTIASGSTAYVCEGALCFGSTISYGGPYIGNASYPKILCPYAATYIGMGGRSPDIAGEYYQVSGTSPNQVLTVEMEDVHCPGSGPNYSRSGNPEVSIQIKLYQATGTIQFIYQYHSAQINFEGYTSAIGINGTTSPSFASLTYTTGTSGTPSTDIQFSGQPSQELALETTPPVFPKTLNYGTTNNQNAITMSVTAKSVGAAGSPALTISGYSLTGSSAFTFVGATPVIGSTLTSAGVTYKFQFLPLSNGNLTAIFTLVTNGVDSGTQLITLSGIGAVPSVSYSATSMFRGVTTEVTDTSGVQYLYVNATTPPGGGPLVVNSVSFIGLDGSKAYVITHLPAGPLAPGGVDSIGVKFTPDVEGIPDAHMVINTTAFNTPWDTVSMYGVGILPHLAIDSAKSYPLPTTVNFDSVKLGSDSTITAVLWNPGSDTVAIEQNFFESDDPDFTFVPLTGRDTLIAPGATQNISIVFTPTQQGTREATIRIRTDIPHTETNPARDTSQFIINVIGVGVPTGKLEITGPLTNGNTNVGTPVTVADTFWNTGNASLTVTYVGISGTNANDFTATYPSVPFTIPGNSNLPFTVTAKPIDSGLETALLTASGTSSETPVVATHALAVYGLLIADTAIVTVPFASESCGSDTMTVTVTNTGNVPESYTASIPLNTNFKVLGSGISPTESNDSVATFLVVFTPTSNTPATGTLNIVGGQSIPPIALSATAGAATIAGTQAAPMTAIGQTSADFTVTVNNTGTCPWTTGTPTVDPQFTYVSGAGTIAAGGSAPFVFTYTPNVAGGASYPVTFLAATGATTAPPNVMITTALDDVAPASESNGFSLNQNYPNPFNETSNVEITLPVASLVHLSIIDVQGQVVETLLNQHYDAGSFSVTLDATGLASGTYYYQMTAGNVTLTRQMVILK